MRAQLAIPNAGLVDEATYNQIFTMHGTVMMFLFAVPVVEAMAVYLLPGMLAARDLPFPRLAAYAYWAYAIGGFVFFCSIFFGLAPDGGWFMYTPLTSEQLLTAKQCGFLAARHRFHRDFGDCRRHRAHRRRSADACAGHERSTGCRSTPGPCWSSAMMIVFGFPSGDHRHDVVGNRTLVPLALLHRREGRRPGAVAAPLLAFWASRGLHHLPARCGHGIDDSADHGGHSARRLPLGSAGAGRHRLSELRSVGAPYVYGRNSTDFAEFLFGGEHGGRRSDRHPDIRLDRHAMGRSAAAAWYRSCSSSVSSSSLRSAG